MKIKRMISALLSGMILSGIAVCSANAEDFQAQKDEVIMLVNEQRAAQGKEILYESAILNQAADIRAKEIISNFSHTRLDGSHGYEVVYEVGATYMAVGENIAYGYSTEADVMNGWMNSSGHRANILNENYHAIGVGVARNNNVYYWVQIFTDGIGLTPMYTKGNINRDNDINSEDASLILSDAAETGAGRTGVLTRMQRSFSDLNRDGNVNSYDATLLLKYTAYAGAGGLDSIETYLGL
ncbi:MAG: hypothetical protein IJ644_10665 [Oscillospiraceae bacterium]|nr:hypothetical protein [Oscillospiraceae bacterium]